MPIQNSQDGPGRLSICPFLGLIDDSGTSLAFPSDWNNCHHCKPVASVSLEHQQNYCLIANHETCIVYVQASYDPLPRNLRNQRQARPGRRKLAWKIILALILSALLFALGWGFAPQIGSFVGSGDLGINATHTGLLPGSLTPSAVQETPVPELALSPTSEPPPFTATPAYTQMPPACPVPSGSSGVDVTPTITRIPHDIETLIGINYIFRIHRVKQGESLNLIAYENGTTWAAISAVNYNFSTPLWVQQLIVIPVNQTDVSELPPFEAYRVVEDINLETLAVQLSVDPTQLQFYNGLGTSNQLTQGEWLVVPREKTQTFTLTATATLVSPHALGVPIGQVQRYLIHQVVGGENLNILATQYQTSIEAIIAVNYTFTVPVWEGALIIIPVEMSNPEGLPIFEAYQVTYEKISVEELAAVLKTDPVLFKYFNVLEDGDELHKDDWMLVPRVRIEGP